MRRSRARRAGKVLTSSSVTAVPAATGMTAKGATVRMAMLIPIVGPSKAGKTETTRRLMADRFLTPIELIDLDEALGPSNRGDGDEAVRIVQCHSAERTRRHVLVDVGAGQLVSPVFESYLRSFVGYPRSVVAIWCDEDTFRQRHGSNADNEVGRYYGATSSLPDLWNSARAAGRLVDSSGPYAPAIWARELGTIVAQMIQN